MSIYLSLIIPAYNEERRIELSLQKAIDYLETKDYSWEIVVVDDGSSDNTSLVAGSFDERISTITLEKNMGKGAAVRNGMLNSSGSYKVFTDADFSTPVYELDKLLKSLNDGNDLAIGSRALDSSLIKEHQPFYREFMGKTFNKIVQVIVLKGISDTQCGFKGFQSEAAKTIFEKAKINGFGFDVELLYLAKKQGYRIDQIPVEWYNDERSKVNPVTDSVRMISEILKIKKLHRS